MGNLRNPQLQEVHTSKGDYLRYKGRDGKHHFLDKMEMPENDTNSVTWAQLKDMRDNALLEPGMLYRITDYATTTIQTDTRSAGHQFDVVVMALSPSTLSERAWAMPHKGDTYFKDSKLEAWQLWYCLDNDVKRFAWADDGGFKIEDNDTAFRRDPSNDTGDFYGWTDGETLLFTNTLYPAGGTQTYDDQFFPADKVSEVVACGKGVIYRMIDEWGNDCPYDFKNIQFKRWAITGMTKGSDELKAALIYDADDNPFYYGIYDATTSEVVAPAAAEIDDVDDWRWHYTFHGWRKDVDGELTDYDKSVNPVAATEEFKLWSAEEYEEAGTIDICKDNVLGRNLDRVVMNNDGDSLYSEGAIDLPNNVFMSMSYCFYNEDESYWQYSFDETSGNRLGDKCYNNTFGNNAFDNTFGNECYNNTFGNSCGANTFGNNFQNNTFGNYCSSNTFGNGCNSNTFGNGCNRNTFGNGCSRNTFGNSCYNNTFGNYCRNNTFGNGCNSNTFGNNFQNNTFGNDCYSNTFGNNAFDNTFGNGCNRNTFGNNFQNNTFGNNFQNNTFGNGCNSNTFGNGCFSITVGENFAYCRIGDGVNTITVNKDYVQYVIIEPGNQCITITSTATTSGTFRLQNFAIALGVNNGNATKTISHNTTNNSFKTTYQNANSDVVDV